MPVNNVTPPRRLLLSFIFLTVSCSYPLVAQNLVPNGGFENILQCPGGFSEANHEFRVMDWQSANTGTPDHFHSCSKGEADVPYNWAGISDAYEGEGYAGIFLWMANKNYREYIRCKLTAPLVKDSLYSIAFRYKLSSHSKYSIDRIGLLLTDSMIHNKSYKAIILKPTLSVVRDSALTTETGTWELAQTEYRAKGNEQHLVIGNFFTHASIRHYLIKFRPVSEPMLASAAYYYIDDVKVIPKFYESEEFIVQRFPEFSPDTVVLNTNYILKNIRFEFNSYTLLPASFSQLDILGNYLQENQHLKIQLSGHTDDVGSDAYNDHLSRNRALSVQAYLIARSIEKHRIETFGYGKTRPLVDGISEDARQTNRRVEVRFIE